MSSFKFLCLFLVSSVYSLPTQQFTNSLQLGAESQPSAAVVSPLFRNRRSPLPNPLHRNKLHYHIHGRYEEPVYQAKPIVQPVYVQPVVQPVAVKPVIQPVVQPIAVKPVPVAQPVCNVCGGGGGFGGGSHSQASSQASSQSFSSGGFGGSSAHSSSQAGSSGFGK